MANLSFAIRLIYSKPEVVMPWVKTNISPCTISGDQGERTNICSCAGMMIASMLRGVSRSFSTIWDFTVRRNPSCVSSLVAARHSLNYQTGTHIKLFTQTKNDTVASCVESSFTRSLTCKRIWRVRSRNSREPSDKSVPLVNYLDWLCLIYDLF